MSKERGFEILKHMMYMGRSTFKNSVGSKYSFQILKEPLKLGFIQQLCSHSTTQ